MFSHSLGGVAMEGVAAMQVLLHWSSGMGGGGSCGAADPRTSHRAALPREHRGCSQAVHPCAQPGMGVHYWPCNMEIILDSDGSQFISTGKEMIHSSVMKVIPSVWK